MSRSVVEGSENASLSIATQAPAFADWTERRTMRPD
jgi:hypothetical protein